MKCNERFLPEAPGDVILRHATCCCCCRECVNAVLVRALMQVPDGAAKLVDPQAVQVGEEVRLCQARVGLQDLVDSQIYQVRFGGVHLSFLQQLHLKGTSLSLTPSNRNLVAGAANAIRSSWTEKLCLGGYVELGLLPAEPCGPEVGLPQ